MIKSRTDYKFYLQADAIAQGRQDKPLNFQEWCCYTFWCEPWKYQKLLRKTEYYQNCAKSPLSKTYFYFLRNKLHKLQIKYGIEIQPNCFGPGLCVVHGGNIIVTNLAHIGANCRINAGVLIGYKRGAPTIGNNVYLGAGAKIFGEITIADGVAVQANSVVNHSITEPYMVVSGGSAKIVGKRRSSPDKAILDFTAQYLTPQHQH